MRMERGKDASKNGADGLEPDESIFRRGDCAKSLGIQRCNSDGVLTQQNGYGKHRPASKSSSEASINGATDSEEVLTMQAHADGFLSNASCALDNNLSSDHEAVNTKKGNGIKKDLMNRQIQNKDSCNITWSQRAVEKRRACSRVNRNRYGNEHEDDHLAVGVNGIGLNVGVTPSRPDYLSNVCDTYRQEADVLFGRTRGGVKNDTNHTMHLANSLPGGLVHRNGIDESTSYDQYMSDYSDSSSVNECFCNNGTPPLNHLMVVAPLAVPENLSDEESVLCHGNEDSRSRQCSSEKQILEVSTSVTYCREQSEGLDNTKGLTCTSGNVEQVSNESHVSSQSDNNFNGAQFEDEELDNRDRSDTVCDLEDEGLPNNDDVEETGGNVENEVAENVEQILEQTRPSSSSSFDSIDDIGDFIEADLPPNVERLAFFARESASSSTTDEDEGCGDEVLANPNEDEESENETIDPLTHADQHNISGERGSESGMKLLNNTSAELLSYSNDFTRSPYAFMNSRPERGACNIVCNKSAEDNEGVAGPLFAHANSRPTGDRDGEAACLNQIVGAESQNSDNRNNLLVKGENSCVSCDRYVDKTLQRKDELGVVVCDKCYNERDLEKNRKSESVVRKKIRTAQHSSSAGRLVFRNSSCQKSYSHDKVNNASSSSVRLSSSDSDPFDRVYVSDSSEMVSPDVDAGVESVFPSSSTSSDGASSVQYNPINSINASSDGNRAPGSLGQQRQSMSLEYETPDEVLYCPYYTRRSRSLDQDLSISGAICNKSSDRDAPNISVSSSNFQEDESNNQEKVFEKQPYHVEGPIPTYSSSDEEENTRVPVPFPNQHGEVGGAGSQRSDLNSLVYVHDIDDHEYDMSTQNIIVADEPIYEDIEDLDLLLEEGGSDGEPDNRSATQPLSQAIFKLKRKKRTRSPVTDVEKVMLWNEYEAYVVQVKQIGTSACGPTAVLNVLKAFDFQVDKEEVTQTITSSLRMEAAPIPYYLFSRYSAGTTAQALVDGVCRVTRGAIKGRFFHFYPKRNVELLKWLGEWMKKGAVPIATLNLQKGVKPGWTIPDAWHHQMVYGVSSKGVYLTNPLEIVPESLIMEQLTSDSVLLVRKQDVVSRFRDWCPLNEILKQRDPGWMTMNVLGQVVHMLREQCMPQEQLATMRSQLASHIRIPAAYKPGISLFMRTHSEYYNELTQAPELPLMNQCEES